MLLERIEGMNTTRSIQPMLTQDANNAPPQITQGEVDTSRTISRETPAINSVTDTVQVLEESTNQTNQKSSPHDNSLELSEGTCRLEKNRKHR